MSREKAGALARIIVGLVLLVSGTQKLFSAPEDFAAVIDAYRMLHPKWHILLATWLPRLEVFAGLALVLGFQTRRMPIVAASFFLIFIAALASTLIRGISLENCGCFGGGIHLTQGQAIALDSFLVCLSYLAYQARETWAPIDAWISKGSK